MGIDLKRPHHKTQRPHSEILLFALSEQLDIIEITRANVKEGDIHERPFETYQKMYDFYDRCIGCEKIEWMREGPDSMIEIARQYWLMKAAKKYPEICNDFSSRRG